MNSRGQVVFVAVMVAVVFIVLALAFAPTIQLFSDEARNSTTDERVGLDCGNNSISVTSKANCVVVDLFNPYFIGFLIFVAGVIVTAKVVTNG